VFFRRFDFFDRFGVDEQFCVARKDANIWWEGPVKNGGAYLFYDKDTGRVEAVAIDPPYSADSIKAAAKALRVPVWWMKRKVDQLAF